MGNGYTKARADTIADARALGHDPKIRFQATIIGGTPITHCRLCGRMIHLVKIRGGFASGSVIAFGRCPGHMPVYEEDDD